MRRVLLLVATLAAAWLGLPGTAGAAKFAVGLAPGADRARVEQAIEARTGMKPRDLAPIPALVVRSRRPLSLRGVPGVRYVEPVFARHLAFTPNDPLAARQWYLAQSKFYASWVTLPSFESVPVAVIDSGVDVKHPEFQPLPGGPKKIIGEKSFVGGSPGVDTLGHGTFVAGLIAANVDNGVGIAGLAPSAQLLVAKVVNASHSIPIDAEAAAIRWAVEQGARVINLSFGGIRDPLDPSLDTYSQLEADAISYAVSNGVVVVAAVGNSDFAPTQPWSFASYPAALPHVLGVSAYDEKGAVPKFSNRDRIYDDIAAPGVDILSLLPRQLTGRYPACSEQGYSSCGPEEYRDGAEGTSFAAPQVSAAAAVVLSLRPTLKPEQVTELLERTADDMSAKTGCAACGPGRDGLSGWGALDVANAIAALAGRLPARDHFEANDDAGRHAAQLVGEDPRVRATVDFWDDQDDVYSVHLHKGQHMYVGLTGYDQGVDLDLALWLPQTRSIYDVRAARLRVRTSARPGTRQYFAYRAPGSASYFVQVRISTPGAARYRLSIFKSS
jgi:subtilisin family serine protease